MTLVSVEDELNIALPVEEANILKHALQVNIETPVKIPTGRIKDLSPPPTTQKDVH